MSRTTSSSGEGTRRSRRLAEKGKKKDDVAPAKIPQVPEPPIPKGQGKKRPVNAKTLGMNGRKKARIAAEKDVTSKTVAVVASEQNAGRDPLEIFPYDVWAILFQMIEKKNPLDCYNIMNACSQFQDMLEEKKTSWMFSVILPHIFAYVPKSDVLKCRQVCKAWRNSVDKLVEDSMNPQVVERKNPKDISRLVKSRFQVKFLMEPILQRPAYSWIDTLLDLSDHPKNPIIGRAITLRYEERSSWDARNQSPTFWRQADRVVRTLKDHVWHLEMDDGVTHREGNNEMQLYTVIQKSLSQTPELKSFSIGRMPCLGGLDTDSDDEERQEANINANPLPVLPHLTTLVIASTDIPDFIHNNLITKYAPQLQRLKCRWSFEFLTIIKNMQIPGLVEFCLSEIPPWRSSLRKIDALLASSKLKSLTLAIRGGSDSDMDYEGGQGWSMDPFFVFLQKFDQLEFLELQYPNDFIWKSCYSFSRPHFVVRSVKTLKLVEIPSISYDIVECFPNLEFLYVKKQDIFSYGFRTDPKACVKILEHMHKGTLKKSNVWKVCRKLKKVQFQWIRLPNDPMFQFRNREHIPTVIFQHTCTRNDYNAYQGRNPKREPRKIVN